MREAGEALPEPCPARRHGSPRDPLGHWTGAFYYRTEHDPRCSTCHARAMLSEHDHLHLSPADRDACKVPGLLGAPGKMVKCKCGSYHH